MIDWQQIARDAAASDPAYRHTNYGASPRWTQDEPRPAAPIREPEPTLEFTVGDATVALGLDPHAELTWRELMVDGRWRADARCLGMDPALFYPEQGEYPTALRATCATCPVQAECLAYAINLPERFGTWGGLSTRQRSAARQGMSIPRRTGRARGPIEHGTTKGYSLHRHRDELPCDECRTAYSTYRAERTQRDRTPTIDRSALDADQRLAVAVGYRAGQTHAELAAEFHVSRPTISRALAAQDDGAA